MDSPGWASGSDSVTAPPSNPAAFAAFAAAFAQRYGSTIDDYQIWDEPNLSAAWGDAEPRPVDYLALLRAAYSAIHGADPSATVIAAALAPTAEQGPDNISDIRYLKDLYALGAAPYLDAAAAKPYGFDTSPDDRTVREDTLDFSRIVALREVMVQHGDGGKALWASAFGWNSLPEGWAGAPSIWGSVSADQRVSDTLAALDRADREWAWIGGMILQEWQPAADALDPQWGFALRDQRGNPTPLYAALVARPQPTAAANALYFPANAFARYSGVWTFGALGADIGWVQDSQLDFSYQGSDLALLVRQDDYVAYLYSTVDGHPANALPRDADGNAILNLTSDTRQPELSLVPVARGLGSGQHTLHITADRGWDRWALAGYAVSSGNLADPYNREIGVALLTAAISALAAVVTAIRLDWSPLRRASSNLWGWLGDAGQIAVSVVTSLALLVGMLLTWGDAVPSLFRREPVPLALVILSAGLIYVQPHVLLVLAALLVLFVIIYHRLDLGLMLVVFFAPFFLFPVALYKFAFPMSELLVLLTAAAWALRALAAWGRSRQSAIHLPTRAFWHAFTPLDYGVAALLLLGALSLAWAEQRGAALTELRTLLLEPALFYLILRTAARDRRSLLRLVDALVIAGIVVAVIGLYQFANGQAVVTAEGGARRLASVYGSPNNVGLFLGRCIPFLLAFLLVRVDTTRRVFAGVGLVDPADRRRPQPERRGAVPGHPHRRRRRAAANLRQARLDRPAGAGGGRARRVRHRPALSALRPSARFLRGHELLPHPRLAERAGDAPRPSDHRAWAGSVSLRLSRALHHARCLAGAESLAPAQLPARFLAAAQHFRRGRLPVDSDSVLASRLPARPCLSRARPAHVRAGRRRDGQHGQPAGARTGRQQRLRQRPCLRFRPAAGYHCQSLVANHRGGIMKLALNIVGILVALTGVVWFLQGIGVLLGSFMSNQSQWALIGALCVIIGVGLLIVNNRRRNQKQERP